MTGTSGTSGVDGTSGTSGPQGPEGPQGHQGPGGGQGPQGVAGPQGLQGPLGAQGPIGAGGTSGTSGSSGTGFTTISNYAVDRVVTASTSPSEGIAQTNLTFDGQTLTTPVINSYYGESTSGTTGIYYKSIGKKNTHTVFFGTPKLIYSINAGSNGNAVFIDYWVKVGAPALYGRAGIMMVGWNFASSQVSAVTDMQTGSFLGSPISLEFTAAFVGSDIQIYANIYDSASEVIEIVMVPRALQGM